MMKSAFIEVTDAAFMVLAAEMEFKKLKKYEIFIKAGEIPVELAFCIKGLFRYYYIDYNGNEYTKHFCPEGNIIISYSAMIKRKASKFNIEALEDSEIAVLSYDTFLKCEKNYPDLKELEFNLMQKIYCMKEYRESELLTKESKERYEDFITDYPYLPKRIKQHQIASYIGVSPVTLSRLKKE